MWIEIPGKDGKRKLTQNALLGKLIPSPHKYLAGWKLEELHIQGPRNNCICCDTPGTF